MTSPGLVASARTLGAVDHYPLGPHQMTARAAQRRGGRPASRWEPRQLTDRRHRATVFVNPACDIKNSSGLAEKNSAWPANRSDRRADGYRPLFGVPAAK